MRSQRAFLLILTLCLVVLSVISAPTVAQSLPDAFHVSFTMRFRVTGKQGTEKAVVTALVPKSIEGRQKILQVKYSPKPEREFEEKGNKYARFVLNNPAGVQVITADVEAEIDRYDLSVAGKHRHEPESKERLAAWLKSEKFVESDAKEIQQAAKSINGADELDKIRNIMAFVHQKIRYTGYDETDHGALYALKNGTGDCTEFSDLFVALCRAKNIPARVWEGYLVDEIAKGDTAKHIRVEAYTRKYGWVPFDPLHVLRKNAGFDVLKPVFVYLGNQRNDTVLESHHFSAYRYFGQAIEFDNSFAVTARRELKKK
jgi:transglutaminase-like putative cysteine protease